MQKILVLGSTGRVGHVLTHHLIDAGEQVRAATRNPASFSPFAGAEPVLFDYTDPSTFAPALEGCDRVFLLEPQPSLPAAPHTFMAPFIEAASRAQCRIVMMSSASVGFDPNDPLHPVEEEVQRSGAPFVILRPNWFMDNFHTLWLEPILQAGVIPVPAGDSRSAFIDSRDVALTAASVLHSGDGDGRIFTLTGPQSLTYSEAASTLSKVSGREISYVPVEDEPFLQSLLEAGLPREAAEYVTGLFIHTRRGEAAAVTSDMKTLTGQAPRPFSQYAHDHASAWR